VLPSSHAILFAWLHTEHGDGTARQEAAVDVSRTVGLLRDRLVGVVQRIGQAVGGRVEGRTAVKVQLSVDHLTAGDRAFRPSAFEQSVQALGPGKPQPLDEGTSMTFLGRTRYGGRSVYKPAAFENLPLIDPGPTRIRYGIPVGAGQLAARDVSAFRLDEALRFGRIPPTGLVEGPFGRGSNQHWIYSAPSFPLLEIRRLRAQGVELSPKEERAVVEQALLRYPEVQRQQMAVLDYVMGNTDRHLNNFRTGRDGEIVAIDNTLSFPEAPDPRFGIRSDFVKEFLDVELRPEVLERVRAVDLDQLRAAWTDAGLSDKAVDGALNRLIEIRTHGTITGDAWRPGTINTSHVKLETAALPAGWIET
jgi:hypothetical protein